MFATLPEKFREYGINADIKTLLLLRKCIDKGLINTLGDIYLILKGIVVKSPRMLGPYTKAYYDYFLNIQIAPGESLEQAVLRSEAFKNWMNDNEYDLEDLENLSDKVEEFLANVHLTSYDIKNVVSGKEIFENDNPELEDENYDNLDLGEAKERTLDTLADYSDLDLEDLLERMKEIAKRQKGRHDGGSHWIGTGGTSPYGFGGAAKGGIRIGGKGGGKMARKVINDSNYFPIDKSALLNDNNIDAALASLKGIIEESAQKELDLKETIKSGLKQGGIFLPIMKEVSDKKLQVILLVDNGGYSMDPYVRSIQELFKKMKTRFAHDLEVYYFHNTIYKHVYSDERRRKAVTIEQLLKKDPHYRVFVIGDAAMSPYELSEVSFLNWGRIHEKFKKSVWLNPEPERYWGHTYTIQVLSKVFPMFPMTPDGIEKSVCHMNSVQ